MSPPAARRPCVWVVASHRELTNEHGRPQCCTVMDEAGTLQPHVHQRAMAEAHADDGLAEAFRWHDASAFAWGFRFHPEWGRRRHGPYGRIMAAYVDVRRAHWRRGPGLAPGATAAAATALLFR